MHGGYIGTFPHRNSPPRQSEVGIGGRTPRILNLEGQEGPGAVTPKRLREKETQLLKKAYKRTLYSYALDPSKKQYLHRKLRLDLPKGSWRVSEEAKVDCHCGRQDTSKWKPKNVIGMSFPKSPYFSTNTQPCLTTFRLQC